MTGYLKRFFSVVTYNLRTRQKLFLSYLLAIMLPGILAVVFFYFYTLDSMVETRIYTCEVSCQQAASQLNVALQEGHSVANHLMLYSDFIEILESVNQENDYFDKRGNIMKLSSIKLLLKEYDEVYRTRFYFSDQVIQANHEDIFYLTEIDQDYIYQKILQSTGNSCWVNMDTMLHSDEEANLVSMFRMLFNPNNMEEVVGLLRVDFAKEDMYRYIESALAFEHSSEYLIGRDGEIFCMSESREMEEEETGFFDFVYGVFCEQQEDGGEGSVYAQHNGKEYLICSEPVSAGNMYLLSAVPKDELTVSQSPVLLFLGLMMALEAIITLCFGAALCLSIARTNDTQLSLLHMQLNPHFLYNTLDMINWKAIDLDAPEIYQPIQALSRLYKLTLSKGSRFVSVQDELEHIRLYVQLQNFRFQNKIHLQMDYDPEVLELTILNMLLQPIVENAVVHGILETETHEGHILVTVRVVRNHLCLCVEDDGKGMEKEELKRVGKRSENSSGYGLWNIQERIRIVYGKQYGVSVNSVQGTGTRVTLTLPVEKRPPQTFEKR